MDTKHLDRLNWKDGGPARRLSDASRAPEAYGIYEIGHAPRGRFKASYLGCAAKQTLRKRLMQHKNRSHNKSIKEFRPEDLWYRCIKAPTGDEARFMEAHYIAAFREDYQWNARHEWQQMWIFEPEE